MSPLLTKSLRTLSAEPFERSYFELQKGEEARQSMRSWDADPKREPSPLRVDRLKPGLLRFLPLEQSSCWSTWLLCDLTSIHPSSTSEYRSRKLPTG